MKPFYIFIFAVILALVGCSDDGPAEDAGEKIDSSMEKMGNQVEDACEKAKEGANMEDQDC